MVRRSVNVTSATGPAHADCRERPIEVVGSANLDRLKLHAQRLRCDLRLSEFHLLASSRFQPKQLGPRLRHHAPGVPNMDGPGEGRVDLRAELPGLFVAMGRLGELERAAESSARASGHLLPLQEFSGSH
jgi:hypothetical protein